MASIMPNLMSSSTLVTSPKSKIPNLPSFIRAPEALGTRGDDGLLARVWLGCSPPIRGADEIPRVGVGVEEPVL